MITKKTLAKVDIGRAEPAAQFNLRKAGADILCSKLSTIL